jgi:O-methyltransferase involved in polyketide biosynthesis
VFGLDARPGQLNIAERQACAADARVNFVYATFADVTAKLAAQSPSQIICSNVLGYLPPHRRRMLLAAMFAALPRGGVLHLADKGWRRLSGLMAQPPWARANEFRDSALASMRDAGFADCAVTSVVPSGKAQHTLFRGVKP